MRGLRSRKPIGFRQWVVHFNKIASDTKKQLGGAKYKVYDSKGKKVYEFTTGKKAEFIEGIFKEEKPTHLRKWMHQSITRLQRIRK